MLIICCVREGNKLCFIIICYCDIKLKWLNIVFCIKIRKGLFKRVRKDI